MVSMVSLSDIKILNHIGDQENAPITSKNYFTCPLSWLLVLKKGIESEHLNLLRR